MPINFPSATFQIIPAAQLAGVVDQRVLIVGQKLSGGTAPAGTLIRDFPSDGSEDALFDQNSHIAALVRAFKVENKVSDLDVLPLEDGGSATKGTKVITLTGGPASADGSIFVTIGSAKTDRYEVAFENGDTITEIATAIVAAVTNVKRQYTIANSAGVVTITAENGGSLFDAVGFKVEGNIPGVTIALTQTTGSNDPTLTNILDAIDGTRYQTILWPETYDLSVVETLLNARFNQANAVMDGVAIQVKVDTLANLKTYTNQNSQSVVVVGQKVVDDAFNKGPATLEYPDVIAAQICAIRALRRTNEAVLSDYLVTTAPNDQFGSSSVSSLPYANTLLPNLPVADPADEFTETELAELRTSGISVIGPNRNFTATIFGEFVTTYLTNSIGAADDSFRYLNTVDTISVIREFYFENLRTEYAQSRLTDGDVVAGRDIVNAADIRAFCNELYDELATMALVQRSIEAKRDYNQNLVITTNVRTGTATINQAPLLVSQLRALLGTIQINFGG